MPKLIEATDKLIIAIVKNLEKKLSCFTTDA